MTKNKTGNTGNKTENDEKQNRQHWEQDTELRKTKQATLGTRHFVILCLVPSVACVSGLYIIDCHFGVH
jgi:hypothetical protein